MGPGVHFEFFRHFRERMRSLEFRHVYRTITSVQAQRFDVYQQEMESAEELQPIQ